MDLSKKAYQLPPMILGNSESEKPESARPKAIFFMSLVLSNQEGWSGHRGLADDPSPKFGSIVHRLLRICSDVE